ncbi:MAG: restriction endonuclease [Bdellovibrionales bacterium]
MKSRLYVPEDFGITQDKVNEYHHVLNQTSDTYNWSRISITIFFSFIFSLIFAGSTFAILLCLILIGVFFHKTEQEKSLAKKFNSFELNALRQYEFWKNTVYSQDKITVSKALDSISGATPIKIKSSTDISNEIKRYVATIRMLHWRKLEQLTAQIFRTSGYSVTIGSGSNDNGADVIARKGPHVLVIQCKSHNKPVSPATIRELHTSIHLNGGNKGVLVSTNGFTKRSLQDASKLSIDCLDSYDLLIMLQPELNHSNIIRQLRAYDHSVRISNMTEKQRFYAKRSYLQNRTF